MSRQHGWWHESEANVQGEMPNNERKQDENSEEFDRFEDLTRKLLKVPKDEAEREREKRAG